MLQESSMYNNYARKSKIKKSTIIFKQTTFLSFALFFHEVNAA